VRVRRRLPGSTDCIEGRSVLELGPLACIHDFCGIDGFAIELHFQDFPVLADEEVYAARGLVFVHKDSVFVRGFSAPVTEQGEGYSNLVGKGFIGEGTVHAHTQDLGVGSFQLLQILLEVFHLLRSTTGEGKDVEGKNDVLLAMVLAEADVLQFLAVEIL